jgi:hypothetical protein
VIFPNWDTDHPKRGAHSTKEGADALVKFHLVIWYKTDFGTCGEDGLRVSRARRHAQRARHRCRLRTVWPVSTREGSRSQGELSATCESTRFEPPQVDARHCVRARPTHPPQLAGQGPTHVHSPREGGGDTHLEKSVYRTHGKAARVGPLYRREARWRMGPDYTVVRKNSKFQRGPHDDEMRTCVTSKNYWPGPGRLAGPKLAEHAFFISHARARASQAGSPSREEEVPQVRTPLGHAACGMHVGCGRSHSPVRSPVGRLL